MTNRRAVLFTGTIISTALLFTGHGVVVGVFFCTVGVLLCQVLSWARITWSLGRLPGFQVLNQAVDTPLILAGGAGVIFSVCIVALIALFWVPLAVVALIFMAVLGVQTAKAGRFPLLHLLLFLAVNAALSYSFGKGLPHAPLTWNPTFCEKFFWGTLLLLGPSLGSRLVAGRPYAEVQNWDIA